MVQSGCRSCALKPLNLLIFFLCNQFNLFLSRQSVSIFFLRCNSSAIQCPCMCTHVVNDALCRGKKYHRHARVYSGGWGVRIPLQNSDFFYLHFKITKNMLRPPSKPAHGFYQNLYYKHWLSLMNTVSIVLCMLVCGWGWGPEGGVYFLVKLMHFDI